MNTNESRTARSEPPAEAWSRQSNATIVAGAEPDFGAVEPRMVVPLGDTGMAPGSSDEPDDVAADSRTTDWSAVVSGPALALAAFVFAGAQAVSGFVAAQAAALIPSAADSPANHVRVVAVIYLGLSCAGGVFAWIALRRTTVERSPRWASYVAGAAIVISALVALQALLLFMLSMLAPANPPN